MIIFLKNKHTLHVDDFIFRCSIGKNGLSKKKKKEIKRHLREFSKSKIYTLGMIDLKNQKH